MSGTPEPARPEPALKATPDQSSGPAALRGGAMRAGAYAGTVSLSLISAPVLIRHLGLVGYGQYATVIALVTVAGGLTDAGMLTIAVREWSTRRGEERIEIMRTLLGLRIELSMGAVLVGVGFALVAGYDEAMLIGTLIAGVGMMFQVCADLLTAPLQGDLRFGWVSLIDLSRQAVFVLAIVALALAGAGLVPFFATTIPASLVALGTAASLARRRMPLRPALRGTNRWALLRETLPYSASSAVNTFYFRVTMIAMALIASPLQTGYFATSFRVTEILILVPTLAVGAAFPLMSRAAAEGTERFVAMMRRVVELALIVGVPTALSIIMVAPFAVVVLAGPSGAPAGPVLQIQAIGLIATFVASASGYGLMALRRSWALLTANSVALVSNVLLALLLVPIAQARGAAIAAVISETALAAGQLGLLLRLGHKPPRLRVVLATALAGGLALMPLLLAVHPLIRVVCSLLIYALVMIVAGQVPPEVGHALEGRRLLPWKQLRNQL